MSEAQHTRLIHDMFAAIDASDWEQLLSLCHPRITYDRPGYDPLVGLERFSYFYHHDRLVASSTHTIEGVLAEADAGACWGRMRGTMGDGTSIDVRFAEVYAFESATILRRRSYFFTPTA